MSTLDNGDSIHIGVTHQVNINGSDAWVKLEITGHQREGETATAAIDRINTTLQKNITDVIESSAKTVMDWEQHHGKETR